MERNWRPLEDVPLDQEIEKARARSTIATPDGPRAVGARYNRRSRRIELELANGCLFAFPAESAQGLAEATADQLAAVEIVGDGYALHWEELDAGFTIEGLLAGRLGTRAWMREHARRAGSVTSPAKARAARENGRKGGRPRKKVREAKE